MLKFYRLQKIQKVWIGMLQLSGRNASKKDYIKRTSKTRSVSNQDEIISLIETKSFLIADVEYFSLS